MQNGKKELFEKGKEALERVVSSQGDQSEAQGSFLKAASADSTLEQQLQCFRKAQVAEHDGRELQQSFFTSWLGTAVPGKVWCAVPNQVDQETETGPLHQPTRAQALLRPALWKELLGS